MNNLPEIRDVFIPNGVSMFPLAYGWWILPLLILFIFFIIKFLFWSIKKSRKHYALKKLEKVDVQKPVTAALQMSELLRRICNVKYKEASALYGEDWISFLNEHTTSKISGDEAKLLVYAPFMHTDDMTYSIDDTKQLKSFCRTWIGVNL